MTTLASQKQLLIAESELNRAQFLHEWQTLVVEVHALTRQAKTIGALASAVGLLVAGLGSFRHQQPAPTAEKPTWWQTILQVARVGFSVWTAFRSRPKS